MNLQDFDYPLPESLIAQSGLDDRASSRLMVVTRDTGECEHRRFRDLAEYFGPGDVIVVNRSRVVPARLYLRRETGGRVEMLFVRRLEGRDILAWLAPLGRLKPGEVLRLEDDARIKMRFVRRTGERDGIVRLERPVETASQAAFETILNDHGHVPLPPYIQRLDDLADRERYQTVYATESGSVAAPTAGLHFDAALIDRLRGDGVNVVSLVLHVGPGTFSPLEHDAVEKNRLSPEPISIGAETIQAVQEAKAVGKSVTAVGTTVTRTLEACHAMGWLDATPRERSGETDLFIYPGHRFAVVNRLITNFHLPKSSLLLLVAAFLGRERTLECYREAIENGYRFYSYGDAMMVL